NVITMVTDGPDVESVLFGENGALETARPGTLCIDMSTISPALTRDLAERAAAKNVRMLDAPVTGGEPGAINATLSIMVGGDKNDFEAARPIFEAMGQTITYCGDHGAGQSVKLCNQICGAMNLLGVCEALILGEKLGVAPEIVQTVISAGAGSSWAMQNLAPKINRRDFSPGFMIDTQQKDMRLVAEAAEKAGVPTLGAALAQQLWRAAQAHGWGQDGIQGMYKVIEQMAGMDGPRED
ncbi:MAG: NAD(P)-dependent oxidoreductase, partial [Armatimonadota bacterium]|nr:NAD(P)-dependent oxidoreductase [Armatimonadota bacterium]